MKKKHKKRKVNSVHDFRKKMVRKASSAPITEPLLATIMIIAYLRGFRNSKGKRHRVSAVVAAVASHLSFHSSAAAAEEEEEEESPFPAAALFSAPCYFILTLFLLPPRESTLQQYRIRKIKKENKFSSLPGPLY